MPKFNTGDLVTGNFTGRTYEITWAGVWMSSCKTVKPRTKGVHTPFDEIGWTTEIENEHLTLDTPKLSDLTEDNAPSFADQMRETFNG